MVENESNMSLITTPTSGNTYNFRCRIPADLIEHFGGLTEFRVSLKCAIKSRALRTTKKLERTVSKLYEKIREGMKVDHKNKMFQIMIKILVCMYILIFYSDFLRKFIFNFIFT